MAFSAAYKPCSVSASRPFCARSIKRHATPVAAAVDGTTAAVARKEFLEDVCSLPGKVRFIVIGDAILESVAPMGKPRYAEIPNKGELATISSADKTFECHLYLSKMTTATLAQTKPKHGGDYDMFAIRLAGDGGKTYLSMLLHGYPLGQYEEGAVEKWLELKEKYGESVTF